MVHGEQKASKRLSKRQRRSRERGGDTAERLLADDEGVWLV